MHELTGMLFLNNNNKKTDLSTQLDLNTIFFQLVNRLNS